jgi:predicted hotdog family 3-hydroxylacyl-ACP dehydratase
LDGSYRTCPGCCPVRLEGIGLLEKRAPHLGRMVVLAAVDRWHDGDVTRVSIV